MNRLAKRPSYKYVPAVPAIPAQAAYCYTESHLVDAAYGAITGGTGLFYLPPNLQLTLNGYTTIGYTITYTVTPGINGVLDSAVKQPNSVVTVQICVPRSSGTPGVAAQTVVDNRVGWNSGARTAIGMPGDMIFKFSVPASLVGAIVGISPGQGLPSFARASHAFLFNNGSLSILEHGAVVFSYGPVSLAQQFSVQRISGQVSFYAGNLLIYRSTTPSSGTAYGDATLYTVGDYVDSPAITALTGVGSISVRSRAGKASIFDSAHSDLRAYSQAGKAALVGGVLNSLKAPLSPAGALLSNYPYSEIRGRLLPARALLTGAALDISTQGIYASLPSIKASMVMLVGGIGSVDAPTASAAARMSDYGYADVSTVWRGSYQTVFGQDLSSPDSAGYSDIAIVADYASVDVPFIIVEIESLDLTESAAVTMLLDFTALEYLGITENTSFAGAMEIVARERVGLSTDIATAKKEALQYAVNIMTGALSTYQGFGFAGFARAAGDTFGFRNDGLYRLSGSTDNGQLLRAAIDFGASEYGDSHQKRMEMAYMGVNTDGEVYVKVRADSGQEYAYKAVSYGNESRAPLAKGVSGRIWNVRLEIADASRVEFDSLEMRVGLSHSRVRGSRR